MTPSPMAVAMRARRALSAVRSSEVRAIGKVVAGPARLRENLREGLHLHRIEDALGDVGIAGHHGPGLGQRLGLEDDEAAGLVEQRAGDADLARLGEGTKMVQVAWSYVGPLGRAVGGIVTDDDEERHGATL